MRSCALLPFVAISGLCTQPTPAAAQRGGAVEFGGFGTFTRFDAGAIGAENRVGAGGRLALYLGRVLSFEGGGDYTETHITASGDPLSVARVLGRLLVNGQVGRTSLYLGAGYERIIYRSALIAEDDGLHGVVGNRLFFGRRVALRIQGRATYVPESQLGVGLDVLNVGASAGLSFFFGGGRRDRGAAADVAAEIPERPWLPPDESSTAGFRAYTTCSAARPGAGVLALRWRGRLADLTNRRLDLAVHEDGFDIGRFVSVWPVAERETTRTTAGSELSEEVLRSFLTLDVTQVRRDERRDRVWVFVDGLQPGIRYFARLSVLQSGGWLPGPTASAPSFPCAN